VKFWRLVRAVWNREPWGHIQDLWGEFTGKLVLCGKPPYQYLMFKKDLLKKPQMLLALVCIVLLGLGALQAQTAILMPMPVIQFSDVNGTPLAGGFIYTYQASTSINQATYTDSTGTTVNTDPIVLNAAGEPSSPLGPGFAGGIYLTNGANYRICVFSANSVQQWCANNVQLFGGSAVGSSSNTQVLFNCAGAVCGNSNFTFNSGTGELAVESIDVASGGSLNGVFTGSPTFAGLTVTGEIVVSSVMSNNTVNCPTAQAAVTGFVQLCNTDAINWRNAGNTGDEGLSDTTGDVLQVSNAGGMVLTGAIPGLAFGGTTVGFGAWLGGPGPTLEAVTATGSAPVPISALTATLQGVTFPTTAGPFTAGQVLTILTPTTANFQSPPASGILEQSTTTISSTVSVPSNTATTWITKAVTMPASGCPCRALVSYGVYWLNGGASSFGDAWVFDGINQFATSQTVVTSTTTTGQNGTGLSLGTAYANSAVVTFTGMIDLQGGGTVEVGPTQPGSTQPSWMNIAIIPST
jgi:hypothetical protein